MSKKNSRAPKRQTWKWIGIAVISLLIVAGLVFGIRNSQKVLPLEIPVAEAYQKYQEGAFILDVRTQEEWDEEHIPGAALIPLDELPYRINEVPADQEIIVICHSGNRSPAGRDILLDAGFERVTSSIGGIRSWAIMSYPLEMQP